ncbi:MAG TPA: TonB-dependent receptor [Chitinophagaceae bacterium]|nr:TonB-dependent receptor [Chitinophagaceae bacterium]
MKKSKTTALSGNVLLYSKIARIMKLTIAFLLIACLQVSAKSWSQEKITLKMNGAEIKKVLFAIEKKSSYRFLFNENALRGKPRVSVDVVEAPLPDILDKLLENTGVGYKILGTNLVVLKEGESINIESRELTVSGRVTSATGESLVGVSIQVKGTRTGTVTDAGGNYSITVPNDATLVFSAVGYETQEVAVAGQTTINITMQPAVKVQEQVIVVGYGTQRKVDVTGSIGQIKGDEIAKQASINPISALQGKLAGVQITNSGAPGASPQIRIRGLGTVYGSATPLYVVDGVWYDDIAFLNPADIETINVLKDASSEAIYGVRAANGVVLITTKKGRGKARVNYSGYVGVQRVTNQVEMANGTEYATLINEMNQINNNAAPFANPESFGVATNWFDVVLRPAMITNHHISMGGSADKSTYNFSLGYLNQEGIVERHNYSRVTARLQNDFQVTDFLKVGYTSIFQGSVEKNSPGNVIYKAFTAAPVVPVYYDDGTYGDPGDFPIGSATNNPKAQLDFLNNKTKTYRLTGNVYGEFRLAKGLSFRTSFGGELGQGDFRNYNPVYKANSVQLNTISKLSITKSETRNWIFENTLTYDKSFGDHKFKFLVGQSAQQYKSYFVSGTADNVPYSSEADLYIALGSNNTTNPRTISDGGDKATYSSYFGRVNYSFMNRYLLTASIRADGSSKFVGDQRWGYFPSVGAGWVISDEHFMDNQHIFNNLKLRGSWGIVGNASVPPNLSVLTVNRGGGLTALYGQPGVPAQGASITTVVPPVIFWEKGIGADIGIEGAVLNNRLNFEIDWYNRKTQDAIFDIPILGSVGLSTSSIRGNQADFQNSGLEFSLGWKDKIGSEFNYSINGNLSVNNNKVLSVVTGDNPIYAGGAAATGGQLSTRTVKGQPIGQFYGLMVVGVFQTDAEAASSGQSGAKRGDFHYADMNKDGTIDAKDRVVLGNPNPKYSYGLNTNFDYKNFDFTLDLQGVAGVKIYNANKGLRYGSENFSKDFYDNRWHGEGTSTTYPSANVGGGQNYYPNSWFVEDGSYLRIRNIQLGYTIPNSIISRWKVERIRFYVNAQNALNFFKYNGFTPEVGGGPTNGGIDNGIYPLSATYNFGVNVTF